MGGHDAPEWVVTFQRNQWSVYSGMTGHYAAEYAEMRQFRVQKILVQRLKGRMGVFYFSIQSASSFFMARPLCMPSLARFST